MPAIQKTGSGSFTLRYEMGEACDFTTLGAATGDVQGTTYGAQLAAYLDPTQTATVLVNVDSARWPAYYRSGWVEGDPSDKTFSKAAYFAPAIPQDVHTGPLNTPAPPVDKTHTTDSLLKSTADKTHTTDSLLKATQSKTHTTDSFLAAGGVDKTHTTDSLLKATQSKTHTTDSFLKATFDKTHTTDSLLKATQSKTHTTDSLLKGTIDKTHSTDSLLKKPTNLSHSTDSLLKKPIDKMHQTDSLLKATLARNHTTDSLLKKPRDISHTTDSYIVGRVEKNHTTDSLLKGTLSKSHSTDSFLVPPRGKFVEVVVAIAPVLKDDLSSEFTVTISDWFLFADADVDPTCTVYKRTSSGILEIYAMPLLTKRTGTTGLYDGTFTPSQIAVGAAPVIYVITADVTLGLDQRRWSGVTMAIGPSS